MKTRSTKKALLASLLSLVVCVSMLVGSTFAWFTDSVTSANNIIKSGNLDVTLEWMDGKEVPADPDDAAWKDASVDAIFNHNLWEPGYTTVRHIKIGNEGSLALKYKVVIEANGEVTDLTDVIDVYYFDPAQQISDRTVLAGVQPLGTLTDVLGNMNTSAHGELAAGKDDILTIALKMKETAGNEYMNKKVGDSFVVKVYATQLAAEIDSFGSDYDIFADYDGEISGADSFEAALEEGGTFKVIDSFTVPEAVEVGDEDVVIDLNGNSITTADDDGYVIKNANGGTLTIGDTAASTTYSLRRNAGAAINGIVYTENSKTIINGGTYNPIGSGYVFLNSKGTLIINNATINGKGTYPVYSYNEGNKLEINNVTINADFGCVNAYGNNSEVVINGGTFNMTGVQGNTSHIVYFSQNTTATINGGTFNKIGDLSMSATGGGGICANGGAQVTITGGSFSGDYADVYKYSDSSNITIKGGEFKFQPDAGFIATGKQAVKMGDMYSIIPADYEKVADGVFKNKAGNYVFYDANGFVWAEAQNDAFFAGKTVMLMNDIDCADVAIKPIRFWDPENKTTFDGQGYTISNLDIRANSGSDNQALFNGTVDIKNVTIDGAYVVGNGRVGALGGTVYGNITNCHIKNSTIISTYWQTGGLVGLHNFGDVIDCSAENTEVYAPSAAGAIIGLTNENGNRKFENCYVKDCVVAMNGGFGGVYDQLFGAVTGALNVDGTTYTFVDCTVEGTTIKGVAVTDATDYSLTNSTVYVDGIKIQ